MYMATDKIKKLNSNTLLLSRQSGFKFSEEIKILHFI